MGCAVNRAHVLELVRFGVVGLFNAGTYFGLYAVWVLLGVPFAQMCNEKFRDPRERILMKNIAYAGSLVAVLNVDMHLVEALLEDSPAGLPAQLPNLRHRMDRFVDRFHDKPRTAVSDHFRN